MKQVFNLPNSLTAFRFALVPVLIVLFSVTQTAAVELAAFSIFVVAAVTDFIDGWAARRYEIVTVLGKLMDPLADKALVSCVLIMLIPLGRMEAWVCLLIILREMIVTGFRGLAASRGRVVAADNLGKYKSTVQYFGLGFLIFPQSMSHIPYQYEIGMVLVYVSLVLAIWSAVDYFYTLRSLFVETS